MFQNKTLRSPRRISRSVAAAVLIGLASLWASPRAQACGGAWSVTEGWSLDHPDYSDTDGLPFLSPGNDSRINLLFLMADANHWTIKEPAPQTDRPGSSAIYSPALFTMRQLAAVFAGAPVGDAPGCSSGAKWKTPFLDDGEGSRCKTLEAGAKAFADAADQEARLAAPERQALVGARGQLSVQCDAPQANNFIPRDVLKAVSNPSPIAKEFAAYLAGASAFYEGKYDDALARFGEATKSSNKWLSETSAYMIGRTDLNKAQTGAYDALDGAPEPKVTDKAALASAEKAFTDYLAAWPNGRYAASARGLLRRLYWLAGDKTKLANEYAWQVQHMNAPLANDTAVDLTNEIDAKLMLVGKPENGDPLLLAVQDLMDMRNSEGSKAALTTAELDRQAPSFKGHESLYGYLRAAQAYYVDKNPAAALKLLGEPKEDTSAPSYLAFSREVLRGQILMATKSYEQAVEHWQNLLPRASAAWQKEAVELGLAISWERLGTINKVFMPGARLSSPRIRAMLLRYVAGPILLREAIDNPQSLPWEQNLARFVLLFKEATRDQYGNFIKDYAPAKFTQEDIEAPTDYTRTAAFNWPGQKGQYPCPKLIDVVQELEKSPQSPHGLLCLGDFVRSEHLDNFETGAPNEKELAGGKSIFPGAPYSRGEVYKALIDKPTTPDRDRAYALYRAINCYAPTGNNQCGGADVDIAQRKKWHDTLKAKYGATSWAKGLKYYW